MQTRLWYEEYSLRAVCFREQFLFSDTKKYASKKYIKALCALNKFKDRVDKTIEEDHFYNKRDNIIDEYNL